MENQIAVPLQPEPEPASKNIQGPPWYGRWTLFIVLMGTYLLGQVVGAIPFLAWIMLTEPNTNPQRLIENPLVIWATLVGAAVGGAATAVVAWGWVRVWNFVTSPKKLTDALWLAWDKVQRIPLWLVALITAPLVFAVSFGVQSAVGPSQVELQQQLFTSPARQVFASLVVSTVVPVAEELIFRGALYGALLPASHYATPKWSDHILPILITTPLFSAMHLLGGFTSLPPFIAVGALSLYLCMLRAVTGSVKSSIVGHMTWNLIGAVFITLSFYMPNG